MKKNKLREKRRRERGREENGNEKAELIREKKERKKRTEGCKVVFLERGGTEEQR